MNPPKLLIADSDEAFSQILETCFRDRFTVRTCSNGTDALELLQSFRPNLILLDLILPNMDGISLLQRMRQLQLPTKALVLTGLRTSYCISALQRLQADYLMLKPCDLQALELRVTDMLQGLEPAPEVRPDPHGEVGRLLLSMGFSPKVSGFRYLQYAIPLYAADSHQAITKELYAAVGLQFQKNAQLVERAIRAAIDTAWQHRDDKIWRAYCHVSPDGSIPRPSNGDFIATIAQSLARQWEKIGA